MLRTHNLSTSLLRRYSHTAAATATTATAKQLRRRKEKDPEVIECNKAISNHMRHGRLAAARQLFDEMPHRTTVTYNAMLSGYLANHRLPLALTLFASMPHRDLVSYNTMLSGHARNSDLASARHLFTSMPHRDTVSYNTMISAYAQSGHVDMAREIFDLTPNKNNISWNGVLSAYVQNGRIQEARQLFDSNPEWDIVSWNAMIAAYVNKRRMDDAIWFFDRMPERDIVSWNTVISGYAQVGDMAEARRLFDAAPRRDVFTYTAMVSGYAKNGMLEEARRVFDSMPERNSVTWNAMIMAYAQRKRMEEAMELFEAMPDRNISSWNTMLTGYAQAGRMKDACCVFERMPQRDSITWSAMIAGYSQAGLSEDALRIFIEMGRSGARLNRSAFTCALSTSADIAALDCGKQVHGRMVKAGYGMGCYVGNALLLMYCKCGSIEEAHYAFTEIVERDVVSWNTLIGGYARHGFGKKALEVFDKMRKTGIKPDDVTMVGVLSACSHAGLVDKGIDYFYSMQKDFHVIANPVHYTCMIDLLGRAGRLEEAQGLINDMPFEPDATMWGALLGASRKHDNTELGEKAAERLFEMEPDNSGMYVLLSNIYATSGKWEEAAKLRRMMHDRGVRKVTGFSRIEVNKMVHTFSVGDSVHPEKEKIYAYLEELDLKLKKAGYISVTRMVLHDVEEEEKAHMLKYHSERLAVAFGILNSLPEKPIHVIMNLKVCEDCHNAIKLISAIEGKLIILRDPNRFHHFSGGLCSCKDYW